MVPCTAKPDTLISVSGEVVLGGRLELPCLTALAPKASAATNYATPAVVGAPTWARTRDLILKRDLLYQLS